MKLSARPEVKGLGGLAPPAVDRAAEIEAARVLAEWALVRATPYYGASAEQLVGLLVRADLREAVRRSEAVNGWYDDIIATVTARSLIAGDPEGALACLGKIRREERRNRAQARAVIALAPVHPDLARRQFAQVLPLAATIQPATEAVQYLAAMALAIFPADRELAELAARKAQELLNAQVPRDRDSGRPRSRVAEALALFDVEAALEMVKDIPEFSNGPGHYEMWVAAGCARVDPARAEQILEMTPQSYRYRDMVRVLCPVLQTDYDRAMRLAQDIGYGRARAMAWLALSMRDSSPEEAWWLYQQAVGALDYEVTEWDVQASSRKSRDVALVAAIGRQIGYPLAGELAWRAAAMRRPSTPTSFGDWADNQTVMLLAMAEPDLARDIALISAVGVRATDDAFRLRDRVDALMVALALADPAGAPEAMRSLMQMSGYDATTSMEWLRMITMLVETPLERLMLFGRRWEGLGPAGDDLAW